MKCIAVLSCVWLLFLSVSANNFTFTYDMALRCKEYLCQHGYVYETFYHVGSITNRTKESDVIFEMHIAILAASNGHILLSTDSRVDASDPVYEIVVGGGANKFSELRRNLRKNSRVSAKTHGVLSPIDFRAFYIKITEDGVIEFGREGETLPIISYLDHDPIPINYFSFAAWNGVEAKFLFDCPPPGANGTEAPNSKAAERNISSYDNLKNTLLQYRNPSVPPAPEMTVDVGLHVTSVFYDEIEPILSVEASILLKWTDDSMAWNPKKFNGTTYLSVKQGQVWNPLLFVFDDISGFSPSLSEPVTILHSGEATLIMRLSVKSWCVSNSISVTKWPQDEYPCSIILEPRELQDKIFLRLMDNNSREMKMFSDMQDVAVNAWKVTIDPIILNSATWNTMFELKEDSVSHQSDRLILNMTLTRRSSAYNTVFYTPLIVLVTFLLMSFWTKPLQMERIWFYSSSVIIICMGLCYMDSLVPTYTIPSILVLYISVLAGIILALLIQVAIMTTLSDRVCKSAFIQNILMMQTLRSLFCLQHSTASKLYVSINEGFLSQDEDTNDTETNIVNVEEMQKDFTKNSEKMEVAEVIDKFLFVVYTACFAVALAIHQ